VLCQRGLSEPAAAARFLAPRLEHLHDPFALADMTVAVDRILRAIVQRERIAVHGDYDVDGITSTVILRRALEMLGADVVHFIPERLRDGYGLQPAAIERLQGEAKDLKRATVALQSDLAGYRARELAAAADITPVGKLVVHAVDGDAAVLKSLAAAITTQPGLVAVLVSTSRPALVAVARSADFGISAQQILADLVKAFGGRGGGRPELAQAGGLNASADEILASARGVVSRS